MQGKFTITLSAFKLSIVKDLHFSPGFALYLQRKCLPLQRTRAKYWHSLKKRNRQEMFCKKTVLTDSFFRPQSPISNKDVGIWHKYSRAAFCRWLIHVVDVGYQRTGDEASESRRHTSALRSCSAVCKNRTRSTNKSNKYVRTASSQITSRASPSLLHSE